MKATFFPYFLFVFCIPVATVSEQITFPLRLLATKITVALAHFPLGIEVVHNGTSIWDPTGRFEYEVAAACSGLRSLTAMFALAMFYGLIEFRKTWQRIVVVSAAFPLAVLGNVVRWWSTIMAAEAFGQSAGNYVHESDWFSLVPYVPAILGLMVLGRWLGKRTPTPVSLLESKPV